MDKIACQAYLTSLRPHIDQFCFQYYCWAQRDMVREVDENFRLVRRIKGQLPAEFLEFIEQFGHEERLRVMRAFLKRGHPRGAEIAGEAISDEDQAIIDAFLAKNRFRTARPRIKIANTAFRKYLKMRLQGEGIGEYDPWDLPTEWRYKRKFGDWTIETYIGVSGGYCQMDYAHIVKGPKDIPFGEAYPRISCPGWLGVASNEWTLLTDDDLPQAVEDLLVLCRHFLNAVPSILAGIELPRV